MNVVTNNLSNKENANHYNNMSNNQSIQRQQIGFWAACSIAIGNVVGSGAFALPASLAKYGNLALLGWAISICGALSLAFIFARLSTLVKGAGGPYAFVSAAYGKNSGYYICYGYWVMSLISNAALAVIATGFISIILGIDLTNTQKYLIEMLVLASVLYLNLLGIRAAGYSDLIITTFKLIPLIGLPILAFYYQPPIDYNWSYSLASSEDYTNLNKVIFATMWAFVGIESTTVPANQIENASKILPRAVMTGTLIASLVYVMGSITALSMIDREILLNTSAPYAELAQSVFGGNWGIIMAWVGLIAVLGTLNGWTIVAGKIPEAASKDGYFPKKFSALNKSGTPVFSLLFATSATALFMTATLGDGLLEQFNFIVDASVTIVLFVYLASVLSYLRIAKFNFLHHSIAIFSILFCCYALYAVDLPWIIFSILLVASGAIMKLFCK